MAIIRVYPADTVTPPPPAGIYLQNNLPVTFAEHITKFYVDGSTYWTGSLQPGAQTEMLGIPTGSHLFGMHITALGEPAPNHVVMERFSESSGVVTKPIATASGDADYFFTAAIEAQAGDVFLIRLNI